MLTDFNEHPVWNFTPVRNAFWSCFHLLWPPNALQVVGRTRSGTFDTVGLPCVLNNSIGTIRFNETNRSTFAFSSLWGKFGGLYACGRTFAYIVPLPNIFLTHLFSKLILKRKDFQEIVLLTWAQEVWSSNLHAPTNFFNEL